ncbi:DUF6048 family protein [Chitinophaga agri]|uniref:Outer membrane protein beta-barrel domain-containing protein n=1 Tax=Chitinophaga agri TaxID=2703787 RepID=A0A6B9ZGB5_9BACT|nr:DUF6048 family protein [Chitinophaga agri]QHS61157.1 hypothetical protein GWR21_16590 [Chitinophaga agri]
MIRTFLCSLSISLAGLFSQAVQAQVKPAPAVRDTSIKPILTDTSALRKDGKQTTPALTPPQKDSIYVTGGGLRLGVDISRFIIHFFQPYRTDIAIQGDIRLTRKLYAAAEVGYNRTSHSDTSYTYKGNGQYAIIGIDYDFLKKKDPNEKNMVYGGLRYGFARNTYEVPAYNIRNGYWDTEQPGSVPKTNMTAHWIELTFGMRVEALPNFFLGWAVREKILLSKNSPDGLSPIVIPGFGSGSKNSQFDMTYTLSYYLPLYKLRINETKRMEKQKRKEEKKNR